MIETQTFRSRCMDADIDLNFRISTRPLWTDYLTIGELRSVHAHEDRLWVQHSNKFWEALERHVWRHRHNIEFLPDDVIIGFLNENTLDPRPENLYEVTIETINFKPL